MIKVLVQMDSPPSPEATKQTCPPRSIEERVRDLLEIADSGKDSSLEWNILRRLYRDLQKRKGNSRVDNLIQMLEPVMHKFGYYEVT